MTNDKKLSKEELELWEKVVEAYAKCGSGTAKLAVEFADEIIEARRNRAGKRSMF